MADLKRVSLAIEQELLGRFDAWIEKSGHGNRSEAIRDLIRSRLIEHEAASGSADSVATVTLVYDHTERELADRLLEVGQRPFGPIGVVGHEIQQHVAVDQGHVSAHRASWP